MELLVLISILVISGTRSETVEQAETCDDVDKTLCDEIFARKPDMCTESCITKLCKRSCGLCPLRCYTCREVSDVTNCTAESACTNTDELCFTVQTFTDNFKEAYKLGCAKKSLCDSMSSKRKVNVDAGCCNSELCNNKPPTLLNVTDSQTLLTNNTTMNDTNMCDDIDSDICQKMMKMDPNMCSDDCIASKLCPHMCGRCFHCLHCDEIDNPNNCNMTTTCANGKECFALETLTSEGMIATKLGCMSKQVCQRIQDPVNHIFGRRQESFSFKGGCCTGDNCNRDIAATTNLSTTKSTTTITTTHEVQHLTTKSTNFCNHYGRGCPPNYQQIGNGCYMVERQRFNYAESKKFCHTRCGANLAEFTNVAKFYEVMSFYKKFVRFIDMDLYIGAIKHKDSSSWFWEETHAYVANNLWVERNEARGSCVMARGKYRLVPYHLEEGLVSVSCDELFNPLCYAPLHY